MLFLDLGQFGPHAILLVRYLVHLIDELVHGLPNILHVSPVLLQVAVLLDIALKPEDNLLDLSLLLQVLSFLLPYLVFKILLLALQDLDRVIDWAIIGDSLLLFPLNALLCLIKS